MNALAFLIYRLKARMTFSVKAKEPLQKGDFRPVENIRDCQGPQPLTFNPALTTCASERIKTFRFSYFAGFAARELM